MVKAAAISTSKAVDDDKTFQQEEKRKKKQRGKNITLSGQASKDEYLARLSDEICGTKL